MCDCSRFIYVCFSHNPSTLTHPSSLFPSKLLLPLSWHATLTLKKSAGLWIYFTPLSLSPCPAFSGRAQKNKAGKRHFCPTTALAAVCSLGFLGKWCARGGDTWKMLPHCEKKLQYVRMLTGLSPKICFEYTLCRVWKPELKFSHYMYVWNSKSWPQSFWYWATAAGTRKFEQSS